MKKKISFGDLFLIRKMSKEKRKGRNGVGGRGRGGGDEKVLRNKIGKIVEDWKVFLG